MFPDGLLGRTHSTATSGRADGRRPLFGNSGPAQTLQNGLKLGQIRRVVAPRRPDGVGARDREGRVEREASPDGGMRLVQSTKKRESGGQIEIHCRIISIGLDRPSKPLDRLLPTAEMVLRIARNRHPDVSQRIARAEAQCFGNVGLCLVGATDENLTVSDYRTGAGEISS